MYEKGVFPELVYPLALPKDLAPVRNNGMFKDCLLSISRY